MKKRNPKTRKKTDRSDAIYHDLMLEPFAEKADSIAKRAEGIIQELGLQGKTLEDMLAEKQMPEPVVIWGKGAKPGRIQNRHITTRSNRIEATVFSDQGKAVMLGNAIARHISEAAELYNENRILAHMVLDYVETKLLHRLGAMSSHKNMHAKAGSKTPGKITESIYNDIKSTLTSGEKILGIVFDMHRKYKISESSIMHAIKRIRETKNFKEFQKIKK